MALTQDDLRSQVLRRATEGVGLPSAYLTEPEVSDFEISVSTQQNVLWFQISIDDLVFVETLHG